MSDAIDRAALAIRADDGSPCISRDKAGLCRGAAERSASRGACFVAFMGGVGFGAGLAASGWTPRHTKAPKIRVTEA